MNPATNPLASGQRRPIIWASNEWSHTGRHSSLRPLAAAVESLLPGRLVSIVPRTERAFVRRCANRLRRLAGMRALPSPAERIRASGVPFYRDSSWMLEREVDRRVRRNQPAAVVLEAVEDQFSELANLRPNWPHTRLVGLCHQPPAWWRTHRTRPESLATLDTLILVASNMQAFWEQYVAPDRIVVIPHGVSTEFFCPGAERQGSGSHGKLKVVFSGQWLRDFDTLADVIALADERRVGLEFDLVIPWFARQGPAFYRMAMSPNVRFHAELTDEQLRSTYQSADVGLMVLQDSTANGGLTEMLACGLPVVVTDIGGVRDYVDSSFAELVPPRRAEAVVEALAKWRLHPEELPLRGRAARLHAERHLAWPHIARQYAELLDRG